MDGGRGIERKEGKEVDVAGWVSTRSPSPVTTRSFSEGSVVTACLVISSCFCLVWSLSYHHGLFFKALI